MKQSAGTKKILISTLHMNAIGAAVNKSQTQQLELHQKHIQALWRHIERLEQFIKPTAEGLRIKVDRSEIMLNKNGTVLIDGRLITLKVPNNSKMITSSGDL